MPQFSKEICTDAQTKRLILCKCKSHMKKEKKFLSVFLHFRHGGGSRGGTGSMTSLSPLSESPSSSSLSLSPSAIIQPDTAALQRLRFEELLQRAEVKKRVFEAR